MSNIGQINPERRAAARRALERLDAALNGVLNGAALDAVVDRVRAQEIAESALDALSVRDRVHFALRVMLAVHDAEAVGALTFAAHRASEHAQILMREAYERECG
mgnify:CR=1 FL=1